MRTTLNQGLILLLVVCVALVMLGCSSGSKQVVCAQNYDPVCGVDGKTYGNSCLSIAANVELVHNGSCAPPKVATMDTTAERVQPYDIEISFKDDDRSLPGMLQLPINRESVIRVINRRSTMASFQLPQLDVYENIPAGKETYVTVFPKKSGYYSLKLNGASYGTFQVQ